MKTRFLISLQSLFGVFFSALFLTACATAENTGSGDVSAPSSSQTIQLPPINPNKDLWANNILYSERSPARLFDDRDDAWYYTLVNSERPMTLAIRDTHNAKSPRYTTSNPGYYTLVSDGELRTKSWPIDAIPETSSGAVYFRYQVNDKGRIWKIDWSGRSKTDTAVTRYEKWERLLKSFQFQLVPQGASQPEAKWYSSALLIYEYENTKREKTYILEKLRVHKSYAVGHFKNVQSIARKIAFDEAERVASQERAERAKREQEAAKREQEAAMKAKAEREANAIAQRKAREAERQRLRDERAAYLQSPEGKAEIAAQKAASEAYARQKAARRKAEGWPEGAVGKIYAGSPLCTSVMDVLSARAIQRSGNRYVSYPTSCQAAPRDIYTRSIEKNVTIMGMGMPGAVMVSVGKAVFYTSIESVEE